MTTPTSVLCTFLLCVSGGLAGPVAAQLSSLPFGSPELPVGDLPRDLACGDLDGDSDLDVAVATAGEGFGNTTISILFNDRGILGDRTEVVAARGPHRVSACDADGDGDLDLVVVANLSRTVVLLANAGDGKTWTRRTFAAGPDPWDLAVGDIDGDRDPDIVVSQLGTAQSPEDTVHVLRNTGSSFVPGPVLQVGSRPSALTLADLDGDADLDLAVGNFASGTLTVLLNDAAGGFTTGGTFSLNTVFNQGPNDLVAGDLDGDSLLDLMIAQTAGTGATGKLSVLLGTGGGGFAPEAAFVTGANLRGIDAADLDGDGDLDLVASSKLESRAVVLRNDGSGSLKAERMETGSSAEAVRLADLDGDGVEDLLVSCENVDHVALHRGAGDGSFFTDLASTAVAAFPRSLRAADLDHDRRPELIVASRDAIDVFSSTGPGRFTRQTSLPATQPRETIPTDVDGDADPDLVTVGSSRVTVHLNAGGGTFHAELVTRLGTDVATTVSAADLDGDRDVDLAVLVQAPVPGVRVLLGRGDGSFDLGGFFPFDPGAQSGVFATFFARSALVDLDGDRDADFVAMPNDGPSGAAPDDRVVVWLGAGDGTFEPATGHAVPPDSRGLAVADLDGDRTPDVAVAVTGRPALPFARGDTVAVLRGDGRGGLGPFTEFETGPGPLAIAAGDVDGDGDADLIAASNARNFSVLENDSRASFTELGRFGARRDVVDILLEDVNVDGRPDVVSLAQDLVLFTVSLGQCGGPGALLPYGSGVNPAGSLVVLSGVPRTGGGVVLGLDNPLGTQAAGALPVLLISPAPDPAFPAGTLLPGFGMAAPGAPGELLVSLPAVAVTGPAWQGPGNPAAIGLPVPHVCSLAGASLFVQGGLVGPSEPAGIPVGLTAALQIVIGG